MNLKRYRLTDFDDRIHIALEVDHDILTPELAHLINSFWSGAENRVDDCDGDEVKAVIKLAADAIVDGAPRDYGGNYAGEYATRMCRKWLHEQEGWPGPNDTPYGQCGIALISAEVELNFDLDFEDEA